MPMSLNPPRASYSDQTLPHENWRNGPRARDS